LPNGVTATEDSDVTELPIYDLMNNKQVDDQMTLSLAWLKMMCELMPLQDVS